MEPKPKTTAGSKVEPDDKPRKDSTNSLRGVIPTGIIGASGLRTAVESSSALGTSREDAQGAQRMADKKRLQELADQEERDRQSAITLADEEAEREAEREAQEEQRRKRGNGPTAPNPKPKALPASSPVASLLNVSIKVLPMEAARDLASDLSSSQRLEIGGVDRFRGILDRANSADSPDKVVELLQTNMTFSNRDLARMIEVMVKTETFSGKCLLAELRVLSTELSDSTTTIAIDGVSMSVHSARATMLRDYVDDISALYDRVKYQGFNPDKCLANAMATFGPQGVFQLAFVFGLRGTNLKGLDDIVIDCNGLVKGKAKISSLIKDGKLVKDPRKSADAVSPGRLVAVCAVEVSTCLFIAGVPKRTECDLPAHVQFPGALNIKMNSKGFEEFVTWLRSTQESTKMRTSPEAEFLCIERAREPDIVGVLAKSWIGFQGEPITYKQARDYLIKNPNKVPPAEKKEKTLQQQIMDKVLKSFDNG